MPEEVISKSAEETFAAGKRLAGELTVGDVIGVSGDLGAGKTVFCRGVAVGLGVKSAEVTSPTFSIAHEYSGKVEVLHFDFYRVSGAEEVQGIGWDDYLERQAVIMVEWPEIAGELLPQRHISVAITFCDSGRLIKITRPAPPEDDAL